MECSDCKKRFFLAEQVFRCTKCGGSVEIIFDYNKLKKEVSIRKLKSRDFDHLRYKEFYPVKRLVTTGEGGTPLIRSKNIEKKFNLPFRLWFKNEAVNTTGSFKDRGSSVEVAKALDLRKKRAVCASTGNMGASVAAYCAVANIGCDIFTPKDAAGVKIEQILAYGANVFKIDGDYTKAEKMSELAFRNYGVYLLGDYAHRREGTKSVGFEIFEQMDLDMKDSYVVCPVGNAILLSAIWKAALEFKKVGFMKHVPKIIGFQAENCSPIAKAFDGDGKIKPLRNPETIAGAIECGCPLDGNRALKALKESGGWADAVSDGEILEARRTLSREEGIFPEPAGAAALAGILKRKEFFEPDTDVICIVTGNGLKTPYTGINEHPAKIEYNKKVLERIFEKPLNSLRKEQHCP